MSDKFLTERRRLREFLQARGVKYDQNKKTWRCPAHQDEHPSAHLYDEDPPRLYCPVCDKTMSIFDVAGHLDGFADFKDMLRAVRDTLGIKAPKNKREPVALALEAARSIYTEEKVYKLLADKIPGKIAGHWSYHNKRGDIIGVDIRIEGEGKKTVLTFWYDGKSLRFAKAPVLIYNLKEAIENEGRKPILIHEGAKCAETSRQIKSFIPCSWSGGSAKSKLANWSLIPKGEIYIFRDDDAPGKKAASEIIQQIPSAKIVRPIPAARTIKPKGADIEEALQVMTPDELTAYILNPENHELPDTGPELPQGPTSPAGVVPPAPTSGPVSEGLLPFKILGIGDDGRAAFISEAGRLVKYSLDGLSKNKLMVLAGRWFWRENYSSDGKMSWDWAIDEVIRFSQNKDFNESDVRGRGAWRDGDKISYHDGVKTHGEYDPKKIYLRLPWHGIGINSDPATPDICKQIKDIVFQLSFETRADAVRALSWAALAPFAGALKFRPAILLTGPSGSGKTTVSNLCIRKLADCEWFNGSESTIAGVRGKIKYDSRGVMFDETEADTQKKQANRTDLFSLMRVSVSDDAPDTVKGTKEGGYNSFKMQNMFGFIAIDPTIESVADENRIFRINFTRPKNMKKWKSIETQLVRLLSNDNCRAIRALVWKKLKCIFALSDQVVDAIRDKTGKDYRSSYADAMLCATFMIVWSRIDSPTDAVINETLDRYYQFQPAEEHRDEAEEFIDRIFEEKIEILHDGRREKISILEAINRILTDGRIEGDDNFYTPGQINEYRLALSRHGIRCDGRGIDPGCIAIVNNIDFIKRITGHTTGYNKIFERHKCCYMKNATVYYYGEKNKKSTIFKGLVQAIEQKTPDDELPIPTDRLDFQ